MHSTSSRGGACTSTRTWLRPRRHRSCSRFWQSGESYGYAILKRVRALSGGELEWTDGMLYPLLHRLRRLGYVTTEWRTPPEGRRRKYYAITDEGRAALADQQRQWATVTRALKDVWPGSGGVLTAARRGVSGGERRIADRRMAGLRRKRPGRQRPRRRRAGGSSSSPDRRAERRRPHGRRGIPHRRETARGRRRPVPRVRTRAQRPPLEAASPERRRRAGARVQRLARAARLRRGRGRRGPGRTPRCRLPRRGADLAGAERQPVRVAVPRRVLRSPTAARHAALGADRGAVRPRSARGQPLPVGRGLGHRGLRYGLGHRGARHPRLARRALVRRRLPVHGRHGPIARAAHGLRPLHGRMVHLLRADRARGWRAHGFDRGDPRTRGGRRRADRRVGSCPRERRVP